MNNQETETKKLAQESPKRKRKLLKIVEEWCCISRLGMFIFVERIVRDYLGGSW